jgi:flagellin
MSQSINTNLISLFGQRQLSTAQSQLSASVERLSSGLRINRAKDDNAGLGISEQLTQQTKAAAVAMRNANDAISMAQTAEGALGDVSDMLGRLKELATQGANDALSTTQRKYITQEMAAIRDEINSVANRTTFNGLSLLTGDFSHAVKGEFNTLAGSTLDARDNTPSITSTIGVGTLSTSTLAGASTIKMVEFDTSGATNGDYEFSVNFNEITLNRTNADGSVTSQTIKLGGVGNNAISVPTAQGDVFTLNFDELGVRASYEVTDLGVRKSGADFAGLIATVGEVAIPTGWQRVSGADWATGSDTVLAKLTSSGGNLRISETTGLNLVDGFGAATNWTDGSQSTISFIGTAAQINAALATLEIDTTNGIGQIDIEIAPQFKNSGFSNTAVLSTVGNTVNIDGWEIHKERVILGVDSIGGFVTSAADNALPRGTLAQYQAFDDGNATYQYAFSTSVTPTGSGTSLQLYIPNFTGDSYGIINGPYLISKDAIEIEAGDTVTFKWKSQNGGDDYDSYAYLLNVDTGEQLELIDSTGNVTPWNTANYVVPTSGNYKFVFIAGTFDASGGRVAGGSLYLDDIAVTAAVPKEGTVKTVSIASGGQFTVGEGIQVTAVNTSGVSQYGADTGIYKLSADASAGTVTLKRFDTDGETLLGSETIENKTALGSGRYTTLEFASIGVSVDLENLSDRDIFLGEDNSGLEQEVTIASSKMASLIGDNGPVFQTGGQSYSDTYTNLYLDTRIGKNTDATHASLFNQVGTMISDLNSASDPSNAQFNDLYNKLGTLMDEVSSRRSELGAVQNRLQAAINIVYQQKIGLDAVNSQIRDVDYATETARMTRMQIGQQAATAMLAQANQIPNVILALLK